MQKKSLFFFSFPSASAFGGARGTIKRAKSQIILSFFEREYLRDLFFFSFMRTCPTLPSRRMGQEISERANQSFCLTQQKTLHILLKRSVWKPEHIGYSFVNNVSFHNVQSLCQSAVLLACLLPPLVCQCYDIAKRCICKCQR